MFQSELRAKLSGVVTLGDRELALLEAHYLLLLRWNQKLNLTTITGEAEAVERHYCESLFLAAHLPAGEFCLADIGSGGGFPGIPVAILRPECEVTLIESRQRKAVFLREAARAIPNVRVIAERAEAIERQFDRAISRAVSYEDLIPALKRLARNADLLTGAEEPPAGLGFCWMPGIRLPWGDRRYLRMGSRG